LQEVQSRLDLVALPSTMPYFSRLEIAADHTVWLMEYQAFRAEPVTGWTVFSSEGDWLGEVELPPAFTVHEFGEHDVLGVWRDKLGVEFVRRYSIQQ
jgi:hypothetical protein